MMKRIVVLILLFGVMALVVPVHAADQINYASQPDEVLIFLNNIIFARDTISLPGGVEVAVVLPDQIYADTLVLRESGERVPVYRLNRTSGQLVLQWQSAAASGVREVTLEYLMGGMSWTPKYDLWLGALPDDDPLDNNEMVTFDFFAEITNMILPLDDVSVRLVAGRVDTSQVLDDVSTVTMNQMVAGYDRSGADFAQATVTGQANIQHIYTIENINAQPGDIVYVRVQTADLPARRVNLWNASTDDQVTVIYKVLNESALPFAEGIARSYQNGLFIGSDFVELTPVGGEGSITVGYSQTMRVNRTETRSAINTNSDWDTHHTVNLEATNFGTMTEAVVIVDYYPPDAIDFGFTQDPERQGDNIFRWEVTLEPGETLRISYQFEAYN